MRPRLLLPEDIDPAGFCWVVASRAGRRVATVDMPGTVTTRCLNGLQHCEWDLHDLVFPVASSPGGLSFEVVEAHA